MPTPFYRDPIGAAQQQLAARRPDPPERQPTPIRLPRLSLRDCVRQRAPRPPADPTWLFYHGGVDAPPVGVERGLFASMEEAHRGGEGEIVDLVYRALRADPGVIAWLGARDIDLDVVWTLVRGGRRS